MRLSLRSSWKATRSVYWHSATGTQLFHFPLHKITSGSSTVTRVQIQAEWDVMLLRPLQRLKSSLRSSKPSCRRQLTERGRMVFFLPALAQTELQDSLSSVYCSQGSC